MSWLDYLVIALVAGYCAYILFSKKKRGCGGCSGCCADCRSRACQSKK